MKVELPSQLEKEMMEKAPAPGEKEIEPPGSVTEVLLPAVSPQRVAPAKHLSEVGQESVTLQENSSEYQATAVQNIQDKSHGCGVDPLPPKIDVGGWWVYKT